LVAYNTAATLPSLFENDPEFWEEDTTIGEGLSYGLETAVEAKGKFGKLNINYNWTKSERKFEEINENQTFPFQFNHEHQLTATFRHQYNNWLTFNLLWDYGSGQRITLLAAENEFLPLENLLPPPNTQLSSFNGFQLPAYHRLDLNIELMLKKNKLSHRLLLGVYNLYNRKNSYLIYDVNSPDYPELNGRRQKNALPLLPSLGYRLTWN